VQYYSGEKIMAIYKSDQQDILFNLNEILNISQYEKFGFDSSSVIEILNEFDKFVGNEIYPTRIPSDAEGVELVDGKIHVSECLKSLNKKFYDMGWYALGLSEDIEGTPVPSALKAACNSLAQGANVGWSMYPGLTKGAMNVMVEVGDEYIKNTYVPKIMKGTWGGTMCLTEAGAGSDVGNLKSTAKPIDGKDGWYKVKGTKIFISSGDSDLYENNIHLVLARTPDGEAGTKGISLFVVPTLKVNTDGSTGESNDVNCPSYEHKMGIHASATCVLNFGDNDNCEGYLIGNKFEGMNNMFIMMNEARLDCGMQGESQANLAYELTKQYVTERVQFGQEIIRHPDVLKMMLKMRAMSRGLRSLVLYTADLFDKEESDKDILGIINLMTPICKSFGSEQGFNVAVDAVQAHGGYGFCTEYGIEQFVRDTKIATIYEGTNGIQAIDFLMRKILKDKGVSYTKLSTEIQKSYSTLGDEFKMEKEVFGHALQAAGEAMSFITTKASEKEMGVVLQSAKDFLDLNAHLVVAWRLMEAAKLANSKLADADSSEKEFLQTKIVDFKIYCSQFLVQAKALSKSISTLEEDISQYKI
jgi:alkylation response protein AidB-like acyl-CoA dehydrogenase